MRRIWNWIKSYFGYKAVTVETPKIAPVTAPEVNGVPGVYLGKIVGAFDSEMPMIVEAVELLNEVVKSAEFKEMVLAAEFEETGGTSNQRIYEMLAIRPHVINVRMFTGSWVQNHVYRTVGYDEPSDDYVHANRYFVQDAVKLMSLCAHELTHAIGFSHSSASAYKTVPYMMNGIVETVAKVLKQKKGSNQ